MLRKKEIYREKLKFDHFWSSLIAYRLQYISRSIVYETAKHTTCIVGACWVLTGRNRIYFEKRLNCTHVLQGHTYLQGGSKQNCQRKNMT